MNERDETIPGDADLLAGEQRQRIRQALTSRFAAFLAPGERLDVDAERATDYVCAALRVQTPDDSLKITVEGAILAADQGEEVVEDATRRLELLIEFLKMQLYQFFRSDRREKFHLDWRKYPVEGVEIRFRGQIARPDLEERADALLADTHD